MLTIITGTPGAGKSLYAVWEEARKVPGSTVEKDGQAIPRRLLSNIKNLLVEHTRIEASDLDTWHTWAQPGDVIVFDEVQEVWRPRGLGAKVPDCIAALETHRHMGVDIILITQHPMLVDPNIRRLCNRHLHLRRLSKAIAYVYEWDHCANPGQVRTAIQSRVWFHPKKAYALYKSAQVHTKPTARFPRIALVGLLAMAALAYLAPSTYARLSSSLGASATTSAAPPVKQQAAASKGNAGLPASPSMPAAPGPLTPVAMSAAPVHMGCIKFGPRCECFDLAGLRIEVGPERCEEGSHRTGYVMPAGHGDVGRGTRPTDPSKVGTPASTSTAGTDPAPPSSAPTMVKQLQAVSAS